MVSLCRPMINFDHAQVCRKTDVGSGVFVPNNIFFVLVMTIHSDLFECFCFRPRHAGSRKRGDDNRRVPFSFQHMGSSQGNDK